MISLTPHLAGANERKILLVEDNLVFHQLLRKQLELANNHVTSAHNAADFLSSLVGRSDKYDVAILDLHLPGLNTDQALNWLLRDPDSLLEELPIILLTGCPSLLAPWVEKLPAVKHILLKPCPVQRLLDCISDCARNRDPY